MERRRNRVSILVMAGGLSRRFGGPGKVFIDVCGKRLIDRVLEAVSGLGDVYIAVSPHTKAYSEDLCRIYRCIETSGKGYPWDLSEALSKLDKPVLVLPADLPFITPDAIESFLSRAFEAGEPVVTLRICREGSCEPIGISLITGDGTSWANIDYQYSEIFMDIDTPEDLARAEEICGSTVAR
ncbi:MAG: NTP transferase domain-containing protein [Sulfolobales archaeon]